MRLLSSALLLSLAFAGAAQASTLSGTAYYDLNRSLSYDGGDQPLSGVRLYLFDGNGTYLANTLTDTAGRYSFPSLADGTYRVEFDAPSWWSLRNDWVPDTTGSVLPKRTVSLAGTATADFGWRAIVRSTTAGTPITAYTGSQGLKVESYNDAVSALEVYTALMGQQLIGDEASHTMIRFDLGGGGSTSTSAAQSSSGVYTSFSAISYVGWLPWLDGGDQQLAHEYGHAWSLYNAYLVQQDPSLASYLTARGLSGDPRLGTSYMWNSREIIAEDYRQLFGSANARLATQMNTDIPPASQVAGLKDFLQLTFTKPPSSSSGTTTPTQTLAITGLSISPTPVTKAATIAGKVSLDATLTLTIRTSSGALVKALRSAWPTTAGTFTATWDRTDSNGRRVKSGAYVARADATTSAGATANASVSFSVN